MGNKARILRITGINGIYDEMYNPFPLDSNTEIEIKNDTLDIGWHFWNYILSEKSLLNLLKIVEQNKNNGGLNPKIMSAINDKDMFINNVNKSKLFLCDQGVSEQEFFSYLEILSIVCNIYNDCFYDGVSLSVNDGFTSDETSSKILYNNSTNPKTNPSFTWILENIIPLIIDYNPDIIFLNGKPNLSLFCVAKILKNSGVKTFICSSRNASEYYSLGKIKDYLKKNEFFFKVFDGAIIGNFSVSENELQYAIENDLNLQTVSNFMYKDSDHVVCTNSNRQMVDCEIKSRTPFYDSHFRILPKVLEDIHLIPYQKCYWNKCTFCGINKKYLFDDIEDDIQFKKNLDTLKSDVLNNGIKYVWFIDEAIPPKKLKELAEYIVNNKLNIIWQARCRIEEALLDNELPGILFKSGLRELRLGLESASLKVLRLMKKFPDTFSLKLVSNIVSSYHNAGISIHFPMIIGFPGETKEDRRITYSYLSFLREKYPLFTFNINILSLDVCSTLFAQWTKYDLQKIELPCPTNEFIGNIALFGNELYGQLDKERDAFIREQLYPWYPKDAYIVPHIFYRLTETIRNTLIWKHKGPKTQKQQNDVFSNYYTVETNMSYVLLNNSNEILIYNWSTHRYVKTSIDFANFLSTLKNPDTLNNILSKVRKSELSEVSYDNCIKIFTKLIKYGFLKIEQINSNQPINSKYFDVASYYNDMYISKNLDYKICKNWLLKKYINLVPKGMILDVGIGCGQNIEFFIKNGYKVHGIDISETAIDLLTNKYINSNCIFTCDDITQVDLPPCSYSLIVCSMSLHYINYDDYINTIKKLKNALCVDGLLYISVLSTSDPLSKYNNTLIKHFFTKEEIINYCNDMELVKVDDSLYKDETRNLNEPHWGIIESLFAKRKEDTHE